MFVGIVQQRLSADSDAHRTTAHRYDAYYVTGNAYSIASGRLSYILGPAGTEHHGRHRVLVVARGACIWPVRACATARVPMALAGGVNLILSPENTVAYCQGFA